MNWLFIIALILLFCAGCSTNEKLPLSTLNSNFSSFSSQSTPIPFIAQVTSRTLPTNIILTAPSNHLSVLFNQFHWKVEKTTSSSTPFSSIESYQQSFITQLTSSGIYKITLTLTDTSNISHTSTQYLIVEDTSIQIKGSAVALFNQKIDKDINDIRSSPEENNSLNTAQELESNSIVSGFVGLSGSIPAGGALSSTADPSDFFQVSLIGPKEAFLHFTKATADIDLFLYQNNTLINSSQTSGQTEVLPIPRSGNYIIEVRARSEASNYELRIQNTSSINQIKAEAHYHLADPFIPNEALILRANTSHITQITQPHANTSSAIELKKFTINLDKSIQSTHKKNLLKSKTLDKIKALEKKDDILIAEPNFIRSLSVMQRALNSSALTPPTPPNDYYQSIQWNLNNISTHQANLASRGNSSITVAVIDSGILHNHPDLGNNIIQGYDFVSSTSSSLDGDGIDNNAEDPGDLVNITSSSFHGTHTASIIGALTNNAQGISAIAPNVSIMPIRALGKDGQGSNYDIMQSILYAAQLSNDSNTIPLKKADVINLSLGGSSYSTLEQNVINRAKNAGSILVAAIGNDASEISYYPASYANVIAVSASTYNNELAHYSNYHSSVDLSAPGGDITVDLNNDFNNDGILGCWADDSSDTIRYAYVLAQGTSSAAPHVSAVIALMKSLHPNLSYDNLMSLIQSGSITDDLGDTGKDKKFGYGKINALKATNQANALTQSALSDLTSTPTSLRFRWHENDQNITLRLKESAPQTLSITQIDAEHNWITISTESINSNKLGSYIISVDKSTLSDNQVFESSVTFTDSRNKKHTVLIQVETNSPNKNAEAGKLYLSLVDSMTFKTALTTNLRLENGKYDFALENLDDTNSYYLYISSDKDNDGLICGLGEICGSWPSPEAPLPITISDIELTLGEIPIFFNTGTATPEKKLNIFSEE